MTPQSPSLKSIIHRKEPGFIGEHAYSKTEPQGEPEYLTEPESPDELKISEDMVKKWRSYLEGAHLGQIWNNLDLKKNNSGNRLQYIESKKKP